LEKAGVKDRDNVTQNLNEAQLQAVEHDGTPLLIVAGPGTGKTLTLAKRVAHLVETQRAQPEQILAVTFTNKAAQEMAERLGQIVGNGLLAQRVTVKTFHGLCFDIVSRESDRLGIASPFSMLNESDKPRVVKTAIERSQKKGLKSGLDADAIAEVISRVKQRLLLPEDVSADVVPKPMLKFFPMVYRGYEEMLRESRLLDFDDLILRTVKLLETDDTILEKYRERFGFIFVDEYQDINYAQYRLVRLLAPGDKHLSVIGDPDQAIYGFRGADVRYFRRFCDDYPGARTIRLRQNYRSTETILQASGQLIRVGDGMPDQNITWSGKHGAKTLTITKLPTERAEAEYIVKTIDQEVGGITHFSIDTGRVQQFEKERSFSDFVVLYRIKEQRKALEEAFRRSGIPFQIVGHEKLQDRKGIRGLVSYLKVGCSVANDFDVERILNFPKRGIGPNTVKALKQCCETNGYSLWDGLERLDSISGLKPAQSKKLAMFFEDLNELKKGRDKMSVYEQIGFILDRFKIMDALGGEKTFNEDLAALRHGSKSFENRGVDFLAHLALEQPQDRYDRVAEKVPLMTMHAAKGLEFPVVFVAGCEDGLVPYRRKGDEEADLNEERRLFYVAMTRAREKIYLTRANRRLWFGHRTVQQASPFLDAIEENLKEYDKPSLGGRGRPKKDLQLSLFDQR
jgi:superfamily I DNA/RNA helicase